MGQSEIIEKTFKREECMHESVIYAEIHKQEAARRFQQHLNHACQTRAVIVCIKPGGMIKGYSCHDKQQQICNAVFLSDYAIENVEKKRYGQSHDAGR